MFRKKSEEQKVWMKKIGLPGFLALVSLHYEDNMQT